LIVSNLRRIELKETLDIGGDLVVRRLGYGAMRLTGRGIWGEPRAPDEARAVLRRAVQLGVNFIDTADSYGPGVSERLIAEALRPYPADLVIATKGGYRRPAPGRWQPDGRPEHLREACEGSLLRLGLDRIDLYQLHTVDPAVPFEDSVGALAELQQEGKIAHVGLSNVSGAQVEQARRIVRVETVQNRYNLVDRGSEDVLRLCEREGIAFICWFPVDRGLLGRSGRLGHIARAHGTSATRIALAWLLHRSPVTAPIPGTTSTAHLEENMAALRVRLTVEELDALDRYRTPLRDRLRRNARRALSRAAVTLAGRERRSPAG
jgi:aryl-alcohol dehydrogenase-like predicted oxidoreductase